MKGGGKVRSLKVLEAKNERAGDAESVEDPERREPWKGSKGK